MKYILILLAVNISSIMCVASAFYLLLNDKIGWGWFLFVAVIVSHSSKISDDKK